MFCLVSDNNKTNSAESFEVGNPAWREPRMAGPCIRAVQLNFALISPRCMMASHLARQERLDLDARGRWPCACCYLDPDLDLIHLLALSRTLLRDEVDVTDLGQC